MDNLDKEINLAAADAQDVAYHQAAGQTSASQGVDAPPPPRQVPRPGHLLRNLLVVTAILVLAGAAAAAWFFLLRVTPERVLGQMIQNMGSVRAFEYKLDVNGKEQSGGSDQSAAFKFSMEGIFDARDEEKPRASVKASGSLDEGGQPYKGEAEARFLEDVAYLRLAKAPEAFKQYTAPFLGQWVRLEGETVQENKELVKDEAELTEEDRQKIGRILADTNAVTFEYTGTEKIDGDAVYMIEYRLDKEGLRKAAPKIYQVIEGKEAPKGTFESFDDALKTVTFEPGQIAVDKKTKLLRKATFRFSGNEGDTKGTAEVTLNLKNYNDAVGSVEAPEGSVTFEELLAKTSTDEDGDGLPYSEEIILGSDPSKRDTDGDSFPDGAEVERGYNPAGPGRLQQNALGNGLLGGSGTEPQAIAPPSSAS